MVQATTVQQVTVKSGKESLEGFLTLPPQSMGLVLFAHGSGSSRKSPRNQYVAEQLNNKGLGTLLFDLLTSKEQDVDERTGRLRFDIPLLTRRLTGALDWALEEERTQGMPLGLFGASTGAAAALGTAAERSSKIAAVVSRGGRPDLAKDALPEVKAPTLLIVGQLDLPVIRMNQEAANHMKAVNKVEIVPGATHLFEEAGKMEMVATLATEWFARYLKE